MTNTQEFSLKKYEEIQLKTNPLVVVICQVGYESILAVNDQAELSKFQKLIFDKYPIFKSETAEVHSFDMNQKTLTTSHQTVSKFLDKDEKWVITLAQEALSLESFNYISRSNFKDRFEEILLAFQKTFQPKLINRIGVRYLNRLSGDAFGKIKSLVHPSLLGIYESELSVGIKSNISEASFVIDSRNLLSRWGLLPINGTIDPNMLAPLNAPSWILDIDTSNSNRVDWSKDHILSEISTLTEMNYNFFRWSTSDDLLKYFGVENAK